jgi:NAD(P)-dependent dehydrogenase (short-subunit alcohol dehydrogenase family)
MVEYDFSDKRVIVTGGGRGIGRSHALGFARNGADVAVFDIDPDTMDDTVEELEEEGVDAMGVECDVTDESNVESAVQEVADEFGGVDVYVNNAGITEVTYLVDLTEEQWDRTLDLNLKGTFFGIKHAARQMIEQGDGGNIVNTASVFGHYAAPAFPHYTASKFGVYGLTRAAALELADYDIHVNCVSPTGVKTPGTEDEIFKEQLESHSSGLFPDTVDEMVEDSLGKSGYWNVFDPPGDRIEPIEVTKAVLWLASDESRVITGISLPVDTGSIA